MFSGVNLANVSGISNNGNQSVSTSFNAPLAGGLIQSVTFTSGVVSFEYAVAAVPEPATMVLSLLGLGVLGFWRRRAK